MNSKIIVFAVLFIVLAGSLGGYFLARNNGAVRGTQDAQGGQMVNTATEVGSTDTKTFRDSAQGTLEKGGINGDGTHKLIRDGGPSQTVYLISSVVDLDQFEGKKVEVWGETFKAQKASWLMDVGRVKILQ